MKRTVRRAAIVVASVAFCLLAFYLALTRSFEFAVAGYVRDALNGMPAPAHAFVASILSHLPVDEDPAAWIVRKAASIVFFGIVGVLARVVAGRRVKSRAGRAWLVIAAAIAMSGAIEIYERPEPLDDIAFDLTCGAVGGLGGVLTLRLFRRL
jgi:hypothetical protein